MNHKLSKIKSWHATNKGLFTFSIAEILISYLVGSRAIDTGSLWQYFFTFVFFFGGVRNIFKLVVNIIHGNRHKAKKA